MSRILEGVFVLGCAVVGLCIDAKEGSVMQDAVNCSVQLIGSGSISGAGTRTRGVSSVGQIVNLRPIGNRPVK